MRTTIAAALVLALLVPAAAIAQPDLEGLWSTDATLFRQYSEPSYTEEGQRRVDAYDVLVDDPSYQCVPSGIGRAWDEPDTAVEITQNEDEVILRYEMFDLVRTVALNQNGHPIEPAPSTVNIHGQEMPTMGHSIAWYEDDALMIETVAFAPGYLTTLLRYPPQSEALRSLEKITRDDEDRLVVEITYVDPIIFTEPVTSTNRYLRSEWEFTVYGCEPDNYDEF